MFKRISNSFFKGLLVVIQVAEVMIIVIFVSHLHLLMSGIINEDLRFVPCFKF